MFDVWGVSGARADCSQQDSSAPPPPPHTHRTHATTTLTVRPLPICAGDARLVKLAVEGTHSPSARRHAGCGQWLVCCCFLLRVSGEKTPLGTQNEVLQLNTTPHTNNTKTKPPRTRSRWSTCPCGRAGRGSSSRRRSRCRAPQRCGPKHQQRLQMAGRGRSPFLVWLFFGGGWVCDASAASVRQKATSKHPPCKTKKPWSCRRRARS